MKPAHSLKIKMGISVAVIALLFVFQNGTCTGVTETRLVAGNGNSSQVSALSVSPAYQVVQPNTSYTFKGAGGTPPYTYSVSGVGSITATGGVYVTSATSGYAIVTVTDAKGGKAQANVAVGNGTGGPLGLTAAAASVTVNGKLQFSATGGTPPYQYSVLSGGGSIDASTGVYTAPANTTSAEIKVVDSVSEASTKSVSVVALTIPTQQYSSGDFTITTDHHVAFTYSNPQGASNPEITVFGMSPQFGAGWKCSPLVAGPPCLKKLTIGNFNSQAPVATSFRGFITYSGRNGSGTIAYCIPPNDPTKALVKTASGAAVATTSRQFFGSGGTLMLFSGASASVGYVGVDTGTGAGSYTVSVTGQYSVNANCSDFSGTSLIQIQPF